jgi:hypothetical protein
VARGEGALRRTDRLGAVRADRLPARCIPDIRHIAMVLKYGVACFPAWIYKAVGID